jgi:hypothetical protein
MNKYKKGFTPDEAALIAVNLSGSDVDSTYGINLSKYLSVEEALKGVSQINGQSQMLSFITQPQGDELSKERLNTPEKFETVIRLLVQAEDIQKALVTEACVANDYEHNRTSMETTLLIYQACYYNDDSDCFWAERSLLTKESLADWFAEMGENEVSKKFKPPKPSTKINPFKKAFIAEHVALITVGLHEYHSIENAEKCAHEQYNSIAEAKYSAQKGDYYDELNIDERLEESLIYDAISLKEAILEEIKLASETEAYRSSYLEYLDIGETPPPEPPSTDIIIYREEDDNESTLITKESVAIWLWRTGQNEYATNLYPNIKSLIIEIESVEPIMLQQPIDIAQKESIQEEIIKTSRTPESSLLDSLGIMAWLLSEKSTKFKRGSKPNSLQIKTAIESVIADLGLDDNADNLIMISNLNKDIALAIRQLGNRFKL